MIAIHFFGPNRALLATPRTEWSVLLTGLDENHNQPTAEAALAFAADQNATAAEHRAQHPDDSLMPVSHAVVLRHGYAWSAAVEHRAGRDCGIGQCIHCGTDRKTADALLGEATR
jgi:hypothetical protein